MPFSPVTADLHNHSLYSHAKDTVAAMAASAFGKGIQIFGFSEHSLRPEGYRYPNDYQSRLEAGFPSYITEVAAEKERYAGRMEILLALEMDYMPDEESYARAAIAAHPYEYVIGGLHFQGLWGFDYSAADWASLSDAACGDIFTRYYQDLARMAETGLFQIAAHPDLVKLFRKQTFDAWVATPGGRESVWKALSAIKKAGMAMEVSSAALRKGLGEPYPGPAVMDIARELDLPISFGSDAHSVNDVAYGFDLLAEYAYGFGYARSVFFRNKQMCFRPFA